MSNVIFVGDAHLKAISPISRCDNFPLAILKKFEYISSICKSYNCDTIILLGDVFDSPVTSLPYLATVINTFKKIHDSGIKVYTIVGNHDIKNNRMDSLQSTALGILISTNFVSLAPRKLVIDNTIFKCYNYPEEIESKSSDEYEVCVAHRYYEFGSSNDSFSSSDIDRLNYNAMVLGHYHVPCDTEKIHNTILYRPGSLSRNTSETYNKLRVPRVLLYNCKNNKSLYIDVPCGSADEVFVDQTDANDMSMFSMKDLINFITSSYSSSDMDVRDYFSKIDIPYECREKISKYLDEIGA